MNIIFPNGKGVKASTAELGWTQQKSVMSQTITNTVMTIYVLYIISTIKMKRTL